MTSELNHKSTVGFFSHNKYFGLEKDQIVFFKQRMLPSTNKEGKILLKDKAEVFKGPDGHGGVFNALVKNKIIDRMEEKHVDYLMLCNVDNPLTNFTDTKFLGTHISEHAEMSTKIVEKTYAEEKVGLVILNDERLEIIEYIDLDPELAKEKTADEKLKFRAGNTNVFIINREFVKKVEEADLLEYVAAFKKIEHLDEDGSFIKPQEPNAYKFERFAFGALPVTKSSVTFQITREEEFAPIKNAEGKDSLKTSQELMINLHKGWMKKAGLNEELVDKLLAVEISPLFALDEKAFVKKVKPNKERYDKELVEKEYFYFGEE